MTMTAAELQAYVDAGLVPSTSGTSTISTPITLDGSARVIFEPNSFVWTGSSSNSLFQYDEAGIFGQPIIFDGVKCVSNVDGSPIFKTLATDDQPHNLHFENCDFTVLGAYAIDLFNVGYIVTPVFKNMVTRGSSALRLFASGTGSQDPLHGTSQMLIRGWTHHGSNRWGPAFNLRGTSGLIAENITDKGSMGLHSSLVSAGWTGPLTWIINSCRTPGRLTNLTVEYDDVNDDDAPNCWIGEVRTVSGTGTGQHEMFELRNVTLRHDAIDAAIQPWHIMGNDSSTGHGLVVRIVDCQSPSTDDFLIGGRCSVWFERAMFTNGESSKLTAIKAVATGIFPEATSWQDQIVVEDGKLPAAAFSGGVTYSGSQNETDYEAEISQPEDVI